MISRYRSILAVALLALLLMPDGHAGAVVNTALGGVGGLNNGTLSGGDGTGTAAVTIEVAGLALVKQARDAAGVVLPDGADVAAGQILTFILFVDNPTPYPADDLQITDSLDETQFTYVPDSMEGVSLPTASSDAALWASTWQPLSDTLGAPDDDASILDTGGPAGPDRLTVGAVTGQANRAVRIPGRTIRAIRFRVRVN